MHTDMSLDDPASLVSGTHVHRSVYRDPRIFQLEMERIFGRAWIYLAHGSELPEPGSYVTRHIGTTGVILTRDRDGAVQCIVNRCTHRGATLCAFDRGESPNGHQCPYHGWLFAPDGSLKMVPNRQNYARILGFEDYAARKVRVAAYRDFWFGTFDESAPRLTDFLGHMTSSIDDLVDRSPTGRVSCSPHVLRHHYRGNWKMSFENLNDTIHPGFAHSASVVSAKHVAAQVGGRDQLAATVGMMLANGKPISFFETLDMIVAPGGHSYIGGHMGADYTPDTRDRYTADLIAFHGEAKARDVLGTDRHLTLLYPSSTWHARYQTVRTIRPVAPDLTEVIGYVFRLEGAPEETWRNALEYLNGANSAASPVISDDLELYQRLFEGNGFDDRGWIPMSRGLEQDRDKGDGWTRVPSTSEAFIRNQFLAWADYMRHPATGRA
jgi:phenylpropionate dioxygenase-like ring-hydroxylating dioxygenase large terminal subunit